MRAGIAGVHDFEIQTLGANSSAYLLVLTEVWTEVICAYTGDWGSIGLLSMRSEIAMLSWCGLGKGKAEWKWSKFWY